MLSIQPVDLFGLGSLGISMSQAKSHAQKISAEVLILELDDKKTAAAIVERVINLALPSIADEQNVINLMDQYGVPENAVTLAMNALPPYEDVTPMPGTPPTPQQQQKRVTIAKKKAAGMPVASKIALAISGVALVGALVLLGTRKKAA